MENTPRGLRMRWQPFTNNAAQEAPAFGVLKITGFTAGMLQVSRPNGSGSAFALSGHPAIAAADDGACTQDWPAFALYDSADGTPAAGEVWGPGTDTFKLKKNSIGLGFGFRIVGGVDTTNTIALVERVPVTSVRVKLDAQLSYQGSVTASVWWYNGSADADTTINITVYDWHLSSGQTIASGKQMTAHYEPLSGRWHTGPVQCA